MLTPAQVDEYHLLLSTLLEIQEGSDPLFDPEKANVSAEIKALQGALATGSEVDPSYLEHARLASNMLRQIEGKEGPTRIPPFFRRYHPPSANEATKNPIPIQWPVSEDIEVHTHILNLWFNSLPDSHPTVVYTPEGEKLVILFGEDGSDPAMVFKKENADSGKPDSGREEIHFTLIGKGTPGSDDLFRDMSISKENRDEKTVLNVDSLLSVRLIFMPFEWILKKGGFEFEYRPAEELENARLEDPNFHFNKPAPKKINLRFERGTIHYKCFNQIKVFQKRSFPLDTSYLNPSDIRTILANEKNARTAEKMDTAWYEGLSKSHPAVIEFEFRRPTRKVKIVVLESEGEMGLIIPASQQWNQRDQTELIFSTLDPIRDALLIHEINEVLARKQKTSGGTSTIRITGELTKLYFQRPFQVLLTYKGLPLDKPRVFDSAFENIEGAIATVQGSVITLDIGGNLKVFKLRTEVDPPPPPPPPVRKVESTEERAARRLSEAIKNLSEVRYPVINVIHLKSNKSGQKLRGEAPLPLQIDLPTSSAKAFKNAAVNGQKMGVEITWGAVGTTHPYDVVYEFKGRRGVFLKPVENGGAPEGMIELVLNKDKEYDLKLEAGSQCWKWLHFAVHGPLLRVELEKGGSPKGEIVFTVEGETEEDSLLTQIKEIFLEAKVPLQNSEEGLPLRGAFGSCPYNSNDPSAIDQITALIDRVKILYEESLKKKRNRSWVAPRIFEFQELLPPLKNSPNRQLKVEVTLTRDEAGHDIYQLKSATMRGHNVSPSPRPSPSPEGVPLGKGEGEIVSLSLITDTFHESLDVQFNGKAGIKVVKRESVIFLETKKFVLKETLPEIPGVTINELILEIEKTTNRREGIEKISWRLVHATLYGKELDLDREAQNIGPGETFTLKTNGANFWAEVDCMIHEKGELEIVSQRADWIKTVTERVRTTVIQSSHQSTEDIFELEMDIMENPWTHEKTITDARLKLLVDLSFFGEGDQLFEPEAPFEWKIPKTPPFIKEGEKFELVFNHPSLDEIFFNVSPSGEPLSPSGYSFTISRLPIHPGWHPYQLDSPNPELEGAPTPNALVVFQLVPKTSRGYQRDGVHSRRYLLANEQIAPLLNWMRLLGTPIDYDTHKPASGEPASGEPASGEPEADSPEQGLEVRFEPTGDITFHTIFLNSDGSLKIEGLDLKRKESATLKEALDGLERAGAVSPTSADLDIPWPTPMVLDQVDILRGDIFAPTEKTISLMETTFGDGKTPYAVGEALPDDFLEYECARSGLILRFPGIFFGRLIQDGPGRARSPLKLVEKGRPVQYYFRGHPENLRPLPSNYILREQGGFPQLYALGRTGLDESRLIHLASFQHPESNLFFAFGDIAANLPADDDSSVVQNAKERGVKQQRELVEGAVNRRLEQVFGGKTIPSTPVYLAEKIYKKGKEITLVFASFQERGPVSFYHLSGLTFDKTNHVLRFGDLTLNGSSVETSFVQGDAGIVVLSRKSSSGEVERFEWDIHEGKLISQPSGPITPVDAALAASLIRARNISIQTLKSVDLEKIERQKIFIRRGAQVSLFSQEGEISVKPVSDKKRGFILPAPFRVIRSEQKVNRALEEFHFHGSVFRPVEETLFAQLLVGRQKETMTFTTDEGIILRIVMKTEPTHYRERYLLSETPLQPTVIEDYLLFIPDPENSGGYVEIDRSFLTVTSKRFAGEERNVIELVLRSPGRKVKSLELREAATSQTLKGLKGNGEGLFAFCFYGVDRQKEEAEGEFDPKFRNRARASLRSAVNFFNLDHGPELESYESVPLNTISPGETGIQLDDGRILDLSITEIASGYFAIEGIKQGDDGEYYIDYEFPWDDEKPTGRFQVRQFANDSSVFQLEEVNQDERENGSIWNMIVTKDGELKFWRRRTNSEEFTAPRASASVEMIRIDGALYKKPVLSRVERRPAIRFIGKVPVEGINLKAALGRGEGADETDLTMGVLPKVPFFVYQDQEGELQIARGIIHEREVEKGDYYPFGYDTLIVDGDEEIVEENHKFIVKLVEDSWQDSEGKTHRGKVRIFFRNKKAQGLDGNPVSPYGYLVFENRDCLLGEADLFKSAKAVAHYHEDPIRFGDRKLLPDEPRAVSNRAGVSPAKVDWDILFQSRGSLSAPHLEALAKGDGSFGEISTYMGALHFLTDTAERDDEKFIHQAGEIYSYDDSILASLALYASALPPGGKTRKNSSKVIQPQQVGTTVETRLMDEEWAGDENNELVIEEEGEFREVKTDEPASLDFRLSAGLHPLFAPPLHQARFSLPVRLAFP